MDVPGNRVMRETGIKRYVVRLGTEERTTLEALISKGKRPAAQVLKARILLKANVSEAGEGWSDAQIVKAPDTSASTVLRARQRLVEEGFDAVLTRKLCPNSARKRIFDGTAEARLIVLAIAKRMNKKQQMRWNRVLSVIAPLGRFKGRARFLDHAAAMMRSAMMPRLRKRCRRELVGRFRLRRE
jgi:hypothetical protein